jgi:transposase
MEAQNPQNGDELNQHYAAMLGLKRPWMVGRVELQVSAKRLEIHLEEEKEASFECPECSRGCWLHDHAPIRRWRHLDALGFETLIVASLPRVRCPEHGVKTVNAPWAGAHSRFTLAFEAFAIAVLQATANLKAAAGLLGLNWKSLQDIVDRAVARGLARRSVEEVRKVGLDEKSFGKGQDYISVMCDLGHARVLDVVPGRDTQSARELWQTLPEPVRSRVEAVAMDMSAGYQSATRIEAPQARIVFDKFHVAKHLGEAVDRTRRAEHKNLMAQGDDTLTGTRYLFLYNPQNFSAEQSTSFEALLQINLKSGRAWAYKELFSEFWEQPSVAAARVFLKDWLSKVKRTRLAEMKRAAATIERHSEGLLNYFVHRITNALSEGFNSRIQQLKAAARGFRNFANYRSRILFFLGSLNLAPPQSH